MILLNQKKKKKILDSVYGLSVKNVRKSNRVTQNDILLPVDMFQHVSFRFRKYK